MDGNQAPALCGELPSTMQCAVGWVLMLSLQRRTSCGRLFVSGARIKTGADINIASPGVFALVSWSTWFCDGAKTSVRSHATWLGLFALTAPDSLCEKRVTPMGWLPHDCECERDVAVLGRPSAQVLVWGASPLLITMGSLWGDSPWHPSLRLCGLIRTDKMRWLGKAHLGGLWEDSECRTNSLTQSGFSFSGR